MSDLENEQILKIIGTLKDPNNDTRKEAQTEIEKLVKESPSLLFSVLLYVLSSNNNLKNKHSAIVSLTQLMSIPNENAECFGWYKLEKEVQEKLKNEIVNSFVKKADPDPLIKSAMYGLVDFLIQNIYVDSSSAIFPEIEDYLIGLMEKKDLEHNDKRGLLKILSNSSWLLPKLLKEKNVKIFLVALDSYLDANANEDETQTLAVDLLSKIFIHIKKKDVKSFKPLVNKALAILKELFLRHPDTDQSDNINKVLASMKDNWACQSTLLEGYFPELFQTMKNIWESNILTRDTREAALEIIVNLFETSRRISGANSDCLVITVDSLLNYALEIEDNISDDFLNPKADFYDNELVWEESNVNSAVEFFEKLLDSNPQILQSSCQKVNNLLLNYTDWKYKYIGLVFFSKLVPHIDDYIYVQGIMETVFDLAQSACPKISYAALISLTEEVNGISTLGHSPEKSYEILTNLVTCSKFLRIQLQACDNLLTVFEKTVNFDIAERFQYMIEMLLTVLFKENCHTSLKRKILEVINEVVVSFSFKSDESRLKAKCYLDSLVSLLLETFNISPSNNPLFGNLLETTMNFSLHFDNYLQSELLPKALPKILGLLETQTIGPSRVYVLQVLQRLSSKVNNNSLLLQISSSVLSYVNIYYLSESIGSPIKYESKEQGISVLKNYVDKLSKHFLPLLDETEKSVFSILTRENGSEEVKLEAINLVESLYLVVYEDKELSKLKAVKYLSLLWNEVKESRNDSVNSRIFECMFTIFQRSDDFFTQEELNHFVNNLSKLIENIFSQRIKLLREKEEEDNNSENEDFDEDEDGSFDIKKQLEILEGLIESLIDLIGCSVIKHGIKSLQIVTGFFTDTNNRFFSEKCSTFEIKCGVLLIDDLIELGQDMLDKYWDDIFYYLLKYSLHKNTHLRRAALFGLGNFSKFTKRNFHLYADKMYSALASAKDILVDDEDYDEIRNATDNAIVSIGKMIKYQPNHLHLPEIVNMWIENLPIENDTSEMASTHDFLCELVLKVLGSESDTFFNLPKLISVLIQIYQSKKSDKHVDAKIERIIKRFKENDELAMAVSNAKHIIGYRLNTKIGKIFEFY